MRGRSITPLAAAMLDLDHFSGRRTGAARLVGMSGQLPLTGQISATGTV